MKKITWIKENVAAEMVGLAPETFRRYVKDPNRAMGINYTHTNNRNYEYCLGDIEDYKFRNSTLYKTA